MAQITKSQMFEQIKAHLTDPSEIEFIDKQLEMIARKAENAKNAVRKPTANQLANAQLEQDIMNYMAQATEPVTVASVRQHFDLTSQKVTPLMNALEQAGKVEKVIDKRVAVYHLV